MQIVTGSRSLNLRFRSHPKARGGSHSLLLGKHPKRGTAIPTPVQRGLRIQVCVTLFTNGIVEIVGDNSVMLWVEACDQSVMVGECNAGIGRNHALGSAGAGCGQVQKVLCTILSRIVITKSVKGYENY